MNVRTNCVVGIHASASLNDDNNWYIHSQTFCWPGNDLDFASGPHPRTIRVHCGAVQSEWVAEADAVGTRKMFFNAVHAANAVLQHLMEAGLLLWPRQTGRMNVI